MNKLLLLLLYPAYLLSQQPKATFQSIPLEHGLSNKAIPAIVEDPQGFLWFATQDGLNKYNGYEFKVYQNDPSDVNTISNNNIFSLIQDKKGFLWLGTENGGLNRFDPHTYEVKRFVHQDNDTNGISSNNIYSILESKSGQLWIGTLESGIDVIDKESGKVIKRYRHNDKNDNTISGGAIWGIYEDEKGIMWISTWGGGLDKLDPVTNKVKHFRHKADDPNSISNNIVGPLLEHNGFFWISTWGGGLNRFDPRTEKFHSYLSDPKNKKGIGSNLIWPIVKDSEGNLWIGTYGSGVNKLDPKTGFFEKYFRDPLNPNSLNYNDVWSLHIDRSGILWVGTEGGGISKFVDLKKQVDFYKNTGTSSGIGHNSVRAIAEDKNQIIWIGSWDGGVDKFDPATNKFTNYKKDTKDGNNTGLNKIRTIFCAPDNKIWLGSYRGGLVEFDKSTGFFNYHSHDPQNKKSISDNYVYSIAGDKQGKLWVGTLNGLNIYDPITNEFIRLPHNQADSQSISNNTINKIYLRKNGEVFIGTDVGLNKLNSSGRGFKRYYHSKTDSASLSHNTIYTLFEDRDGILWIGTRNGLDKFIEQKNTFEHYTTNNGLSDNIIMSIEEDSKGQLLISTKKGISRFNKLSKTFINYDVNDGITGRLFFPNSSCCSKSGKMYFGSTEGLDSFYPDSIESNKYIPPVVITNIKKHGEVISFTGPVADVKEVVLPWDENNLTFEFVALSYASPLDNQYSLMLEGADRDWLYNGNSRVAHYANLLPGTYVFKVRASNNDGLWNYEGARIKIVITPPFWKTIWFYVICALVSLVLIVAFIKYRERKLYREKKLLERKVDERTAEVVRQKHVIEEKHKEITDSINYAERIQRSFLATESLLAENISSRGNKGGMDYFVFFQPKDIVSGDFYWGCKLANGNFILVTADSTGHGVPGAIMSILNISSLEKAIEQGATEPSEILNQTRAAIIDRLKKDGSPEGGKDGMDASLICFEWPSFNNQNQSAVKLTYAAANNPVWIVRKQARLHNDNTAPETELIELPPDKMPVGKHDKDGISFRQNSAVLQKGDMVYTFTDGMPDQFGGAKKKKFMYKQFKELLISVAHLPVHEQKQKLDITINAWKGDLEQVDDITVVGVRI